jgi:hypothetical protein
LTGRERERELAPHSRLRWAAGLPRATQAAIKELVRSRSPHARVWLPDGLELRFPAATKDVSTTGGAPGGGGSSRETQRKKGRGRLPRRNSSG